MLVSLSFIYKICFILNKGCVQEEIRFLINTELIVSRLFTATLDDNECLIITGAERYCSYKGYAETFEYEADFVDKTKRDQHSRRETKIVAMDAISFRNERDQFSEDNLIRELNKAYVSFVSPKSSCPIATGNWGCGAFNGNIQLKAVIQLMVATEVDRELYYYTWGNANQAKDMQQFFKILEAMSISVGHVYNALLVFCDQEDAASKDLFKWLTDYFVSFT